MPNTLKTYICIKLLDFLKKITEFDVKQSCNILFNAEFYADSETGFILNVRPMVREQPYKTYILNQIF